MKNFFQKNKFNAFKAFKAFKENQSTKSIASLMCLGVLSFGKGFVRDLLKTSALFAILFALLMLHLTKTIEIPPLTWLFEHSTSDIQSKPLDDQENTSAESMHVPDLLP